MNYGERVVESLKKLRLSPVTEEHKIHQAIAELLTEDGIGYEHEVKLGPRNRIDFVAEGGIGIEVKKGKPNSTAVMKQVERYCKFEAINELVLLYPGSTSAFAVVYVVSGIVSGGVFAGGLSWWVVRGLAKTGALSRFPSGRTGSPSDARP